MKRYGELYAVEIKERDPPLAVTRLIDHLTTQIPGLVTTVPIEAEKVRAGSSKTPSNLANITSIPSMLQRGTEN